MVLTPRSVAGGQFNKITDQNWKLNIDLRRQSNGGAVQIINVNSLMLVHMSISKWYDPINGSKKFLSSDYLWIGKLKHFEVIFTFSLFLDSLVWNDAVLRGTNTFYNLPSQCELGEVPAIISNSNQYDLFKQKFSNVEADKQIWLGIIRTATGTLNIISFIRNKK